MKTAMWMVFIFILGLFGIFLISTFGNITTTNQQDYTLLKNAVEAAMEDSIDRASLRAGFYLCIDNPNLQKDSNGTYIFNSTNDYHVVLNTNYIASSGEDISKCELLNGETKIFKDVFMESFIRRYVNNIHNNKSYKVTIQEVIEYPPKVSVRIDTSTTYNSTESKTYEFNYDSDYDIANRIDAILEDKS